MDRTRWIIFTVVCLAVIVGLVALSNRNKLEVSDDDVFRLSTNRKINDHVYGNKAAKVIVYEYADFQCPGCGGAYPNVKIVKEKYKDTVGFVYRHFPLTSIHPHAFAAAAASEAAGLQGKFWEMYDLLFSNHNTWSSQTADQRQKTFEDYATQLGLDMQKYRSDITSDAVAEKINYDRSLGLKAGVEATPSIFVNKTKQNNEIVDDLIQQKGDKLSQQIETALKAAGVKLPASQADNPPATAQ